MLKRKIYSQIKDYLHNPHNKVLIIDGARQVGKSFIIRHIGQKLYPNFIEINLLEDYLSARLFANTRTLEDFYLQVSMLAGNKMQQRDNTLIFLDEIQAYPHLLTLLKFLQQDAKFTYIASGSLLGVTLAQTTSIPIGSIEVQRMYPLDFEEFLWANGFNEFAIDGLRSKFRQQASLDEAMHNKMMDLFKKYLLVGGLPDAVNTFLSESNIAKVRKIQDEIHNYYALDASKYDEEKKLKIRRIYEMIPSNLENKKKRLIENSGKNLLKLYLNDVGILTSILYKNNIRAVLDNQNSINLGTVYESVVASELKAHGYNLYYYDNRNKGEVDFLIDDYNGLSTIPLEIKSGKDYSVHSALSNFVKNPDYHIQNAYVLSNERLVQKKGKITYLPIYYIMFFCNQ